MGAQSSAADRKQAAQQNAQAIKEWMDLHIPDPAEQQVIMDRYIQTGELDPKSEEAYKLADTELSKVSLDPKYKESQLRALSSLEDLGSSGGMTLNDEANLQKGLIDINSADRGRRESINDNFARRGMGGSGMELVAQLQGAQDAATRQSTQQLDTLGSARERALQAIMGGGELAGKMRGQEYGEQSDLAQARDAIAKFNTMNAQSIQQRNVDRSNQAQEYNLNNRQRISDANVDLANKEKIRNADLIQQQFQNRSAVAAGKTGQYNQNAAFSNAAADRTANNWANIGAGAGQTISSLYGSGQSKAKNEQMSPEEDEEMLKSIKGYNYKNDFRY